MSGLCQFGFSKVVYMLHILENNIKLAVKTFHFILCLPVLFSERHLFCSFLYLSFSLILNFLCSSFWLVYLKLSCCLLTKQHSYVSLIYPVLWPFFIQILSLSTLGLVSFFLLPAFVYFVVYFWSLSFTSFRVLWCPPELLSFGAPGSLSTCSVSLISVSYLYPSLEIQLSFFQTSSRN